MCPDPCGCRTLPFNRRRLTGRRAYARPGCCNSRRRNAMASLRPAQGECGPPSAPRPPAGHSLALKGRSQERVVVGDAFLEIAFAAVLVCHPANGVAGPEVAI